MSARTHQRMTARVVGRLGGRATATIRRRHTVRGVVSGDPPTLRLAEDVPAGAAVVSLVSDWGAGVKIAGQIPTGVRVVIGGSSYRVATDTHATDAGPPAAVDLSEPLEEAHAAGTPVEVEDGVATYAVMRARRNDVTGEGENLVRVESESIVLSAEGAAFAPRSSDRLVLPDGQAVEIDTVHPLGAGAEPTGWRVTRR